MVNGNSDYVNTVAHTVAFEHWSKHSPSNHEQKPACMKYANDEPMRKHLNRRKSSDSHLISAKSMPDLPKVNAQ